MKNARQPAGELRASDAGRKVLLKGWVGRRRDLGDLIFLTVRDRSGTAQVLFDRVRCPVDAVASASEARSEDVVEIEGEVALRVAGQANPDQKTGEIEIVASRLEFLARADTPPFSVEDRTNASEDLRLEYRYLDLRRPSMLANFVLRDEIAFRVRRFLHERGFLEVETPLLTRSTPEGARDFLVPSRIHRGEWYALPQSPQIFKQILMVAGFEKYFQIARCFRDEDNRADRQPEFTQIDIEMSFPTEEDVMEVVEPMLADVFAAAGIRCETPFPRLTYAEAVEMYGTDRPDLRFGLTLTGLDGAAAGTGFAPFDTALSAGGTVRGLRVPGGGSLSRKQLDTLGEEAKQHGAPALLWVKRSAGEISSPAKKHIEPAAMEKILSAAGVEEGDLLLIVAASRKRAFSSLGALRLRVARDLGLIDESQYRFCWVTEFPLLEHDEEAGRWFAMHHPFTSPREEDLPRLEDDPGSVRARAYDVVLNGTELGGGSIRIHRADVQSRVFQALGIAEQEARDKFGFLLDALRFGAPPHGGIAFGLDRICMLAAGGASIRDVIAFPKTSSGLDLMAKAPSAVGPEQLRELGLVPPPSSAKDE